VSPCPGKCFALAATPVDQGAAEHALDRRDLLAQRRLRASERLGGSPEGAAPGDRLQRQEMAQFELG